MLAQIGCTAILAENTHEALEVLNNGDKIDLLLCDIFMDNSSSFEMLKICRTMYPDLPVVLMSAYTKDEVVVKALREGAHDFLVKPFEIKQLVAVLRRVEQIFHNRRKISEFQKCIKRIDLEMIISSKDLSVEALRQVIQNAIQSHVSLSKKDLLNISLALEEAALNAHEHGNLELHSEWKEEFSETQSVTLFEKIKQERLQDSNFCERKLLIKLNINQSEIQISIADSGAGFKTGRIATEAAGTPYGMGLMLINNLMDEVRFNDKGNELTFIKRIGQNGA